MKKIERKKIISTAIEMIENWEKNYIPKNRETFYYDKKIVSFVFENKNLVMCVNRQMSRRNIILDKKDAKFFGVKKLVYNNGTVYLK